MSTTYTQCGLERSVDEGGALRDTAFIPSKFAVVGKVLRIGEEEGWVVRSVGATLSAEQAGKAAWAHQTYRDIEVAGRPSYKDNKKPRK